MAVSSAYQDIVDLVDDTKTLVFVVDAENYGPLEFSYDGLTVTGGTEHACAIGARDLLDEMGLRVYTPKTAAYGRSDSSYRKLPASIPTDLTRPKGTNWIPNVRSFLGYNNQWSFSNADSRPILDDAFDVFGDLTGTRLQAYPAGHGWPNVIESNLKDDPEDPDEWFDENFHLLKVHKVEASGPVYTFDLEKLTLPGYEDDYAKLVNFCAAYKLENSEGQHAWDTFRHTNFDPVDGDQHSSDLVYPFTQAVVARMRSGTDPVMLGGGVHIAALDGEPRTELGLYAYAGHRLPPAKNYGPGVITGQAFGFNQTGLTYLELYEGHSLKNGGQMTVREYFDAQVWNKGQPLANGRAKKYYFERLNPFQALGCLEVNGENTANWLVNLPMNRALVLKCRTGEAVDWDALIDEIAADIFDDDPKVKELYHYWMDPVERFHKWSLRKSFDIVSEMADSWYKTDFERLLTIHYQYYRIQNLDAYGIVRNPGEPDDTFADEISKLLAWVTAVREDEILHSYALVRQEANAKLNDYPHLKFNAANNGYDEPDWSLDPSSVVGGDGKPTHGDFEAAYAAITAETVRDENLDGGDLVLVPVEPLSDRDKTPAAMFKSQESFAAYLVIGPATLTVIDNTSGESEVEEIAAGEMRPIALTGDYSVRSDPPGRIWPDLFPQARKDPDAENRNSWLYVPKGAQGQVNLIVSTRWRFDDGTQLDWNDENYSANPTPFLNLGPGQVCVDNTNTRGQITNVNCNRYLSPDPNYALMPSALAAAEGKRSRIRIAGN